MVIRSILLVLIAIPTIGCGSNGSFVGAEGSVIVDGRALSGATITFEPINDTPGPNATAAVLNGRFLFGKDAGLRAGTYRVRVAMIPAEVLTSFPPAQRALLPPDDSVISPAFDSSSQLTCTLQSDRSNELHFEVGFL